MKEIGIIMSGDHPKLILEQKKTMTRRVYGLEVVNQFPDDWRFVRMEGDLAAFLLLKKHSGNIVPARSRSRGIRGEEPNLEFLFKCPYGQVGDRLWARATWSKNYKGQMLFQYQYHALNEMLNLPAIDIKWKPSIHLLKEDAEIWLEITEVRAERLQEITPLDCLKEGINLDTDMFPTINAEDKFRRRFQSLWDSLNAKRGFGWDKNNWVFPISFKLLKGE